MCCEAVGWREGVKDIPCLWPPACPLVKKSPCFWVPYTTCVGFRDPPPLKRFSNPSHASGSKGGDPSIQPPPGIPILTLGFFRLRWLKNCL